MPSWMLETHREIFQEEDEGPFYLTPDERVAMRHDRNPKSKKKNTTLFGKIPVLSSKKVFPKKEISAKKNFSIFSA